MKALRVPGWRRGGQGLLLILVGCSGGGGPTSPATLTVATVTVTPQGPAMNVGESQQLSATLRDAAGNVVVGRTITWTSSDNAIATVNATGLVQGLTPGQAMITARSEGKTGTTNVTIQSVAAAVATITITPATLTLNVGDAGHLAATLQDAAGNVLVGRPISWTSSEASFATVDATGLVRGVAPGQATIMAASEGKTATATVTIQSIAVSGQKIAFNTNRDGNFEIYIMNPDGTGLINLTRNPGDDNHPAWSPDGSKIAFASDRSGNYEVYVMDADGSNVVRLTQHPHFDGNPSWSGSRIAFVRDTGSIEAGATEVFVMNSDGTDPVNLTNNPDFMYSPPSFSRDGTKIAFESDRDFDIDFTELTNEIFVMNADGTNPVNVTNTDTAEDGYPKWSPDGSRIAFHSNREGRFSVYVMNADGSNAVRLTQSLAGDFAPSWSSDGSKIVFERAIGDNIEIHSMNSDGSGIQRLTNHPAGDARPVWRP